MKPEEPSSSEAPAQPSDQHVTEEQSAGYIGQYTSDEAEVTFTIARDEQGLMLKRRPEPSFASNPLVPMRFLRISWGASPSIGTPMAGLQTWASLKIAYGTCGSAGSRRRRHGFRKSR